MQNVGSFSAMHPSLQRVEQPELRMGTQTEPVNTVPVAHEQWYTLVTDVVVEATLEVSWQPLTHFVASVWARQ